MMFKLFHILLLSVFYFHCIGISVVESWQGKNVTNARNGEFSFSVALIDLSRSQSRLHQYFCTGALISSKHVLTTDICMLEKRLSNIKALISESHWSRAMVTSPRDIVYKQSYTDWARSKNFEVLKIDLAVLTLQQTTDVVPIRLSSLKNHKLRRESQLVMASWSISDPEPVIFKKAYVKVLPRDECLKRIPTGTNDPADRQVYSMIEDYLLICSDGYPAVLGTLENRGSPVMRVKPIELLGIHHGPLDSTTNLFVPIDFQFIKEATTFQNHTNN